MKKTILILLTSLAMGSTMALATPLDETRPTGGSSVPWPWPWAKQCPINYANLNATFVVKNSKLVHFIQITTNHNPNYPYRYLKIRLYNHNFDLLAEGDTYVDENSRSVFVRMVSSVSELQVPGLKLRIYYKSENTSCENSNLIPILTVMDENETEKADSDQMILEPMSNWDVDHL